MILCDRLDPTTGAEDSYADRHWEHLEVFFQLVELPSDRCFDLGCTHARLVGFTCKAVSRRRSERAYGLFRRAHHFKCWKPLHVWPLNLEDFITVVLDYKKIVRNLRKRFCHFGVERWLLKAAPMPLKLGTVYTHGLATRTDVPMEEACCPKR